jgi:hypothetical protein
MKPTKNTLYRSWSRKSEHNRHEYRGACFIEAGSQEWCKEKHHGTARLFGISSGLGCSSNVGTAENGGSDLNVELLPAAVAA